MKTTLAIALVFAAIFYPLFDMIGHYVTVSQDGVARGFLVASVLVSMVTICTIIRLLHKERKIIRQMKG